MKLAISNIAWPEQWDDEVYELAYNAGFSGIEIAPTRVIPQEPYNNKDKAVAWLRELKMQYGFCVPSMQSIWFGRTERIFGAEKERVALISYTRQAIEFAQAIECGNLVFGCPRNRNIPDGISNCLAVGFFRELGEYARAHNTVIGMEANPTIYNTNYINTTSAALELIEQVNSDGFKLNLDIGTMIHNKESLDLLDGKTHMINHVHISEPGLKGIENRDLHKDLARLLHSANYSGYVSVEMGRRESVSEIAEVIRHVAGIFA